MCLSWNILIFPSILKDNFAWHSILCSHLLTFRAGNILPLIFLTIRAVGRSEVILIVLSLCVSCHFSHTTFSIVPFICIFDILIMCLTEIFLWWYLCRVLNISSICMSLGLGSFLLLACLFLFFQCVIFIDYLGIFYTASQSHSIPITPRYTPHPCVSLPKKKKNTLPHHIPCWKPSTMQSYALVSLQQFLRTLFSDFLSELFLPLPTHPLWECCLRSHRWTVLSLIASVWWWSSQSLILDQCENISPILNLPSFLRFPHCYVREPRIQMPGVYCTFLDCRALRRRVAH